MNLDFCNKVKDLSCLSDFLVYQEPFSAMSIARERETFKSCKEKERESSREETRKNGGKKKKIGALLHFQARFCFV